MSLIKILSDDLVNQIAAGEVVERPASVVKELVENSLDAGADRVVVEIRDFGKKLIKVSDNGVGMSAEDCEMALQRHATSKLSEESDLWKIRSMGFRGEALASISSVSKMSLRSKREVDLVGTEVNMEGSEKISVAEVGMAMGTQIEVWDLFFNTPARLKYLKKRGTELMHITTILNRIVLANPKLALKLIHNEKVVSDYAPVTDLISRIGDVFGRGAADAMVPIYYGGSDFEMNGFIGKPLLARSSSKSQYFFVNGRPIQHHLFAHTVKRAYHSMLMEHKKPMFLINIKIDPALIDVNVHPRKIEIRFEDEQRILKTLYGAVKKALESNVLIPKGFTESRRYMSDRTPVNLGVDKNRQEVKDAGLWGPKVKNVNSTKTFRKGPEGVQEALDFVQEIEERGRGGLGDGLSHMKIREMEVVVQVQNSYIIAQNEEGLILIDQHAAHERVRYEKLMSDFEAEEKAVQSLLMPLHLELSKDEILLLEENEDIFRGLGFEMEPFGGNTFVIRAVPSCLAEEEMDSVIRGVLDDIRAGGRATHMQGRVEEMLTYLSCRSAIKFGQKLSMEEMESLIKQLDKVKNPYTCPHGRPTMVSLSMDELSKMFGRK